MSAQWSDNDRALRIARRNVRILADGGCDYCRPNRGENAHGRDGRWVQGSDGNGTFVPSKTKDRK